MFVCICNAIRETEIREAACAVAGDAEAIYRSLGKEPQCRLCLEEASEIVADARGCRQLLHFA